MSTNTLAKIIAGAIGDSIHLVPDPNVFGQAFALNVFKRIEALGVDKVENGSEFLAIMQELEQEANAEAQGLAAPRTANPAL